jgi:thiamine pyrophosphokinase
VIAADSGLHHATALGHHIDLAIGDFDSVDPDALAAAEHRGTAVERHPEAKDHTDLELALDRAVALGAERIIVVGGHGGRLDHFLANLLVLASPRYIDLAIEAHIGPATVHNVRGRVELKGRPDEVVTLLPIHGPAHGVTTEGLRYPLRDETLDAGSTRGVSNVFVDGRATVSVESGLLITIQPGGPGAHLDLVVKGART